MVILDVGPAPTPAPVLVLVPALALILAPKKKKQDAAVGNTAGAPANDAAPTAGNPVLNLSHPVIVIFIFHISCHL